MYVRPATLRGLWLKREKRIVPSKSSYSATGPKKALICVWAFFHYFYDPYASRDAVDFFGAEILIP